MPPRPHKDPRILLSGTHDPSVIPAPRLSSNQVTTIPRVDDTWFNGPNLDPENRPWVHVPAREYDLAEALREQGVELNFDLLLVQANASRINLPRNLGSFDCPKILLLGDTHHMHQPLQAMLEYALSEDFDGIVSLYDRHHLHWFQEIGLSNLAWIPGLGIEHTPTESPNRSEPRVCFVGAAAGMQPHVVRTRLLGSLTRRGVPLLQRLPNEQISRAEAADFYRRSAIAFNCSLNGDLNLRVFEVLAAGGFLLTDQLAVESGLGHAFAVGEDLVTYSDAADLLAKVEYFLDRPGEAAEIAAQGHRTFLEHHDPAQKVDALLDWALGGPLDPRYDPSDDFRFQRAPQARETILERAAFYEKIQEEHRLTESLRVLLVGSSALRFADDLSDLPRLQLYCTPSSEGETSAGEVVLGRDRVREVPFEAVSGSGWGVILHPDDGRIAMHWGETEGENAIVVKTNNESDGPSAPSGQGERERFLVIRINHSHAGFFAYVNFALNQLTYAEKHDLRPVVYFGPTSEDGPNAFYDRRHGDNTWDYYFEPVAGLTYADLQRRLDDPDDPVEAEDVVTLTTDQLWEIHCVEPDSIFPYPHNMHRNTYHEDPEWYPKQRARAHRLIERYVRVKPHVLEKVDKFQREHFGDTRVLGVHMRGTDKGTADGPPELMRIVRPPEYFPHIDAYTEEHGPCQIFIATDQKQFVEELEERYGDRVLAYDAFRASGIRNPFEMQDDLSYKKGEEVLIDCLLLSRCDHLLKCTSAVGEFAAYFEPRLSPLDLNHEPVDISPFTKLGLRIKRMTYLRYLEWKARTFRRNQAP
ncbi:MAG: nodulation protein NodZ [Acidobacteriota bacterium]